MTVDTVAAHDASLLELGLVWVAGRQERGEIGAGTAQSYRSQLRRVSKEGSRATVAAFCLWMAAGGHVEEDRVAGLRRLPVLGSSGLAATAERYVAGRQERGEIGAGTAQNYRSQLGRLVALHGDQAVVDLGQATIGAWQAAVGSLAPSCRRGNRSTVMAFCGWLVDEGALASNPAAKLPRVRQPRTVPRALAGADVRRLLAALPDQRAMAIIQLMVGLGLRCVEVSRLRMEDYDPAGRTVLVTGKAGHQRVLPVPTAASQALDLYLRQAGVVGGPLLGRYDRPHEPLKPGTVSKMAMEWVAAAGIKHRVHDGVSAHALRHTAASDVLDRCGDLRVVQEMLGHANLATTSRYLRRADLGKMREAMEGRDYLSESAR